jgi:hypothetical protein
MNIRDQLEEVRSNRTEPRSTPAGWLQLTPAEAAALLVLPYDHRLIAYIGRHAKDQCPQCDFLIGNHSLRYFKVCAASELQKFSLELLEILASEATDESAQS